jgi:hypothetical protein
MSETEISKHQVGNLKKITLKYSAGTKNDLDDLVPEFSTIEFIFGVASEGLTPFEYEIVDKNEGDTVALSLSADRFGETFQHLQLPDLQIPNGQDHLYLKAKIVKVVQAENREIIKAMAEINACGGCRICSCGCGGKSCQC